MAAGEVTRAVRAATTPAGEIAEGDWLGVVAGDVAVVAEECVAAALAVLGHLVGDDAEVVTIFTGSDADEEATSAVLAGLAAAHPDVEVEVVSGGQPLYPYLFGVE